MRNQTFFQSIVGILIIGAIGLIGISVLSSANVTKLRPNIYEFTLDTIAQSASGTFTIPDQNKSRTGIGFSKDSGELDWLGTQIPLEFRRIELPAGRGFFVSKGKPTLVQTPFFGKCSGKSKD